MHLCCLSDCCTAFFYTNAQTQLIIEALMIRQECFCLLYAAMTASSCALNPFILAEHQDTRNRTNSGPTLYLCHDLGLKSQAWCCCVVVCWCENCGVNKEIAGRAAQSYGVWTEVTSRRQRVADRGGGAEVTSSRRAVWLWCHCAAMLTKYEASIISQNI